MEFLLIAKLRSSVVLYEIDSTHKFFSMNLFLDCTAPFQILFVANAKAAEAITTVQQRGFCLEYKQVGC